MSKLVLEGDLMVAYPNGLSYEGSIFVEKTSLANILVEKLGLEIDENSKFPPAQSYGICDAYAGKKVRITIEVLNET